MWISALLLLSLCGGILGTTGDDFCDGGMNKACVPKEPFPWEFPKTAEDMDHVCPMLLNRLVCLNNYMEKCGEDEMLEPDYLNKVLEYLRDVCNKDSKIHDDIVTQLPCFKELIDNTDTSCRNSSREAMKVYEEHARANDPEFSEDYYSDQQNCFFRAFEISCFLAKVDITCGTSAKQIALDAQKRTGFLDRFCPDKVDEELLEIVHLLEIEIEQRDLIHEIISSNVNA